MITTTVADQIIQVIEHLGQKFGIAIDWSAENILPLAQVLMEKIARWCVAQNIFYIGLSLIGLIVGLIVFTKAFKKLPTIDYYDEFNGTVCVAALLLFGAIGIAGIIGFFVNTYNLVQSICFPELAVFEYIQSFISNGG